MKLLLILFALCSFSQSLKINIGWNFTNTSASIAQQSWFQEVLWPPVQQWFEKALPSLTRNMTRNLSLSTLSSHWACSNVSIPPGLLSASGVATEYFHVIQITEMKSFDAKSNSCFRDQTGYFGLKGRPLVGETRFSVHKFIRPSASSTNQEYEYDRQLSIIIHELTHALVMESGHFFWFLDPNFQVPTTINYNPIINYTTTDNRKLSFLNATSITNYLRAWHENSNVPGLPLEYDGNGEGTHVNMRAYPLETMTFSAFAEQRITKMTMHVYNSSGWYVVDFFYAEPFNWAHKIDPDDPELKYFLQNNSVLQTIEPAYYSFETPPPNNCSYTGRFKNAHAVQLDKYKPLALIGPNLGTGDCWNMSTPNSSVETFSPQSRCFEGSFAGYSDSKGYCLRVMCLVSNHLGYELQVNFQGNSTVPGGWFTCPSDGVAQTPFGSVNCPHVNDYCNVFSDGWWGDGIDYCVRGCMDGYGGTCKYLQNEPQYRCV